MRENSKTRKKLVIKYLDSVLNINGYGADEYPVFKDVSKERSFVIMKKELKDLINKIIFCVATEDTRPALKGCCLSVKSDYIEGVSSDGFRLALSKKMIKNNGVTENIVVPAKSLLELGKLMDDEDESVSVYVEKNSIMVDLFHTKLVSRLIAETYMSYEKIIQVESESEVTIDKKVFESAMDRVALIQCDFRHQRRLHDPLRRERRRRHQREDPRLSQRKRCQREVQQQVYRRLHQDGGRRVSHLQFLKVHFAGFFTKGGEASYDRSLEKLCSDRGGKFAR